MESLRQRATAAKVALSSREGLINGLLVKESAGFAKTGKTFAWSNAHMDPSPPEERTWEWWNFAALWWAYGFSTGVWTLGSSMVAGGLTAGQAVICVFIAHTLGAIAIVVNSRFGAVYHTGYPVYQRISFGPFGSFFPILLRCGTGIIWVGVQLYQGGEFTSVILRCIFGNRWAHIPNTIPLKSGITTVNLAATLIFTAVTLPLLFMKIHNTRWLWTIKAFVLPPAVIGLFIYTQVMSSGGGGHNFTTIKHFKGSTLAWTMLKFVNSAMGKTSPSQVNQPDLSRYSRTRSAPGLSQLITLPLANTAVACLGIFATSAVYSQWGVLIWNPWSLCSAILDHHWTRAVRFAMFLVSLAFTLSIFVSNQAANVIPFGADMTAIAPRILNINRGQVLSYALGLCICPWYILASATSFLTFLGGYSIFLGPIVGISGMDYFWRKGNINVPSLYTASKAGHYYYGCGFHWRAYVAFWLACIPTLPGFAGTFGHKMPAGFVHLFYIGWLYSIVSGALIYLLLMVVFPPRHLAEARAAPFESWADEQKDLLDRTVPIHEHSVGEDSTEKVEAKMGHEIAGVVREAV